MTKKQFKGWGRRRTGRFASWCQKTFGGTVTLLEDGFIRSIGLGTEGASSFSWVEDDAGIYYDATKPSRLENMLNRYDFASDTKLMDDASRAIAYMLEHHISKYNNTLFAGDAFCQKYRLKGQKNVLVVAQTAGDASLVYGMSDAFDTEEMVDAAIDENPDAKIYLKIHPDVLYGKKRSDIDIEKIKEKCVIIEENVNPISLLKHFDKVYTKTSGMGFEALLCGCECVCFGMPFYAGWGVTTDKSVCQRRKAKRSVEEIFAAAYIVYTHYYNPYTRQPSDIFDTMQTIVALREEKK